MSLERMGATSAGNVLAQVESSRTMPLGRFLHALGLPGIGPELATAMAQHFGASDAVLPWVDRALATVGEEAFGPPEDDRGKPHDQPLAIRELCSVEGLERSSLMRSGTASTAVAAPSKPCLRPLT